MNQKTLKIILVVEALLLMALNVAREALPQVFTAALAFPFEQVGYVLRTLSLFGGAGNVLSLVLYVAFCLIPLGILLRRSKKRGGKAEDFLLGLLSPVLFLVLYFMINPGLMGQYLAATDPAMGKAILGGVVYSILTGYLVLVILRLLYSADREKLQKYLSVLLSVLTILFVYLVFGVSLGGLLNSISSLQAGNTGNEPGLGMSYLFLIIQYLVDALPHLLNVVVVLKALDLLQELGKDRYSTTAVAAAGTLSRLCGSMLAAVVLTNIGFNLLQLLFMNQLLVVNSTVQIPLLAIAFVLAILLMAQFIGENKELKDDNRLLKDDNDLFI